MVDPAHRGVLCAPAEGAPCCVGEGTGGVGGFESIRGSDASEVKEYLGKPAGDDIMAAHAQGYTSAQLDAIIAYLKQ